MNLDNYECTGQMSLFDLPEKLPTFSTTAIYEDGFEITLEYDHPDPALWEPYKAKHGYLVDFRMNRGGLEKMEWRQPCLRFCEVECYSLKCFLKRGYIRHEGKWVRNDKGEILIANNRECDWNPKDKPKEDCKDEEVE